MHKRRVTTGVGLSTFMMLFTVLCMMVFATLAYLQARRNEMEADKVIAASEEYYAADYKASQIYEEIQMHMSDEAYLQQCGVQIEEDLYKYSVEISETKELVVTLRKSVDKLLIEQWQEVVNTNQENYDYQGFVH